MGLEKYDRYSKMAALSKRIYKFIDTYATLDPNWDSEYDDVDDKFASPDASMMKYCADMLSNGIVPDRCFSE